MKLSPVSPVVEVPTFPKPILALPDNPFVLSTVVPAVEVPVLPKLIFASPDNPHLRSPTIVPPRSQARGEEPVDATQIKQTGLQLNCAQEAIEISSDEEDEGPPPKRPRVRAPSVISLTDSEVTTAQIPGGRGGTVISVSDSEDGLQSSTSNKENVAPLKMEPTSPPPYIRIPWPPKDIIELPHPALRNASALSTADKFHAIVSRGRQSSQPASHTNLTLTNDPGSADLAANALFAKLVQNVSNSILKETVEKMTAELIHRGDPIKAGKKEDTDGLDNVNLSPKLEPKTEIEDLGDGGKQQNNHDANDDNTDDDDDDDTNSLFSRAASSASWEANALISNDAPFADIYCNETERLARPLAASAAFSLNIRAVWELRVVIWYLVSGSLRSSVWIPSDGVGSMICLLVSSRSSSTPPMGSSVSRRSGSRAACSRATSSLASRSITETQLAGSFGRFTIPSSCLCSTCTRCSCACPSLGSWWASRRKPCLRRAPASRSTTRATSPTPPRGKLARQNKHSSCAQAA